MTSDTNAGPTRQRRIVELFNAAVEMPPGQRDDFLAQACGGDLELQREIESLLACDTPAAVLEKPLLPSVRVADFCVPADQAPLPERIGAFSTELDRRGRRGRCLSLVADSATHGGVEADSPGHEREAQIRGDGSLPLRHPVSPHSWAGTVVTPDGPTHSHGVRRRPAIADVCNEQPPAGGSGLSCWHVSVRRSGCTSGGDSPHIKLANILVEQLDGTRNHG